MGGKGKKNVLQSVLPARGQEGLQPSTFVLLQSTFSWVITIAKDVRGGN
jgi:hypothetical protein